MQILPVIGLTSVTKRFGQITGVKNATLAVEKGEVFGFLGPNGSGKTTTIRMMLDLLRPDEGKIEIFGKEVKRHSYEIRHRCGYLPGNFSAYGNLTGNEFFKFVSGLRGVTAKLDPRLPNRLGIAESDLKRKIRNLSHGTLQKIGIIQAFAHSPELLILDEPTIGLDPLMQFEFYELLKEYQAQGGTVFLSSHNLSEIEQVCQRVAIIRNGQIVKEESIVSLRRQLNRKIVITLKSEADRIDLPGARLISHSGKTYEFEFSGEIVTLLKGLSDLPVADVILPEPDLKEIFMKYYNGKHEE